MNTRIIVILTGIMLMFFRGNAQTSAEKEKMQGRWEIVKVEAILFGQGSDKVLERKVLTVRDSIRKIGSVIPLVLLFEGNVCTTERNGALEKDSCRWAEPHLLLQDQGQRKIYYNTWQYSFTGVDQLEVRLPAVFYMDPQRMVPVKRQFNCIYNRKG